MLTAKLIGEFREELFGIVDRQIGLFDPCDGSVAYGENGHALSLLIRRLLGQEFVGEGRWKIHGNGPFRLQISERRAGLLLGYLAGQRPNLADSCISLFIRFWRHSWVFFCEERLGSLR